METISAEPKPTFKFSDDPMFKRVMKKPEICKGVLERILGRPVDRVTYTNTQQEHYTDPWSKEIRMDAYLVESNGRLYDVEMQANHNPKLPLRMRGYQSVLDASHLKRGYGYRKLRESFIIFICLEDPFGAGLPVYTIERTCLESEDVTIECNAHWLVLNASAYGALKNDDGLALLLRYVYTDEVPAGDALLESVDAEVAHNNDKEWATVLMDSISVAREEALIQGEEEGRKIGLQEGREEGRKKGLQEGREQGREEGRERGRREGREEGRREGRREGLEQGHVEGQERYARLADLLMEADRLDDLKRANADPEVRQKLFEEFGI